MNKFSRADLESLQRLLQKQSNLDGAVSSRAAVALGQFLRGESPSLDHAFGFVSGVGMPLKTGPKTSYRAIAADLMRNPGDLLSVDRKASQQRKKKLQEIAESFGVSVRTVERVRKLIKEYLEGEILSAPEAEDIKQGIADVIGEKLRSEQNEQATAQGHMQRAKLGEGLR